MKNVSGHIAILAGAGVAAALLAFATYLGRRMETAASAHTPVVVTVPQRPSVPAAQPSPRPVSPAGVAAPRDPVSLTRQLQTELRRVGCYDGELSGAWTPRTRAAMKAFTDRVNASLPVDKPDQVLLALVQSHPGVACVPPPVLAKAPTKPELSEADVAQKAVPAVVPPIVAVTPKLLPSSNSAPPPTAKAERGPPMPAPRPDPAPGPTAQAPTPPSSPGEPPLRTARHGGPVPAVGIYEGRARRTVRPYRQVRYARALIRSLKRAAMPPWRLP
jgi:hypothetical protein